MSPLPTMTTPPTPTPARDRFSRLRRAAVIVPAAALLALAGCADNPNYGKNSSASGRKIVVTVTDGVCAVNAASTPSGRVSFTVTNNSSVVNEFEILTENQLQIIAEQENLGPGTSATLTTALEPGTYYTACKPNMVGRLVGLTKLTVTQGEEVTVSADVKAREEEAVKNYTAYIRDQVGQLLTDTKDFAAAYTSGDTARAKELFPLARMHYERIEPTAEAFGIKEAGDIDAALDPRIQDLAVDAGKAVTDPSVISTWIGWHRIEADLWSPEGSTGDAFRISDATTRKAVADRLVADTQNLYDLVYGKVQGPSGAFELSLSDVANGASDLLEEVALSKIVGEEETFSHTDLYDFVANVEGAEVAYGNVKNIVTKADPSLDVKITKRLAAVKKLLAAQESGKTSNGATAYKDYSTIATVQQAAGEAPADSSYTDVQREFSDAVNALSEEMAQVAGTVLH